MNDITQYRRHVGRLIYLTITPPKLSYSVHILSQFMLNRKEEYMEVARRILQYLKGNLGQGILKQSHLDLQVVAFCDLNSGACPITRCSLTELFCYS